MRQRKLIKAVKMWKFSCHMCRVQHELGGLYLKEHPAGASSWRLTTSPVQSGVSISVNVGRTSTSEVVLGVISLPCELIDLSIGSPPWEFILTDWSEPPQAPASDSTPKTRLAIYRAGLRRETLSMGSGYGGPIP